MHSLLHYCLYISPLCNANTTPTPTPTPTTHQLAVHSTASKWKHIGSVCVRARGCMLRVVLTLCLRFCCVFLFSCSLALLVHRVCVCVCVYCSVAFSAGGDGKAMEKAARRKMMKRFSSASNVLSHTRCGCVCVCVRSTMYVLFLSFSLFLFLSLSLSLARALCAYTQTQTQTYANTTHHTIHTHTHTHTHTPPQFGQGPPFPVLYFIVCVLCPKPETRNQRVLRKVLKWTLQT